MTTLQDVETTRPTALAHVPSENRLLKTLPPDEYARVARHLHAVTMMAKQVFHKQGQPIRDVYFPGGGACSLIKVMDDGNVAQIATVGNEGIIGAGVFFGDELSAGEAIVQASDGEAHTMPIDAFIIEMARHGSFYDRVVRYSQAFTTQIMQTTVCNGLHSAEQRCCRWLLMTHDRVRQAEFGLTHEFLAVMLSVRRPTVTLIATKLQKAGLISYRRGYIRIIDRPALEKLSCECYETVKAQLCATSAEQPPHRSYTHVLS